MIFLPSSFALGISYAQRAIITSIVFILFILYYRSYIREKKVRQQLADKTFYKLLFVGFSQKKRFIKYIAGCIGIISLFCALLRPSWGVKEHSVKEKTRDLLIALDVSRSMLAQDIAPSRLQAAQVKIRELVNSLAVDRVGLILFASSAVLQCPLTTDKRSFFAFLDTVDTQSIAAGSTSLDTPLKEALKIYSEMTHKKHKLLTIFTDGEDFSGSLAHIKDEVQKADLKVFTVGVGTETGAPIPQIDIQGNRTGYEMDANKKIIMSCLNTGVLKLIALDSGGSYVPYSNDSQDIKTIITQIEQYEKEDFAEKNNKQKIERYAYFAAVAFGAFLLEWML
jgi:Ca-activated chloride channel family protein